MENTAQPQQITVADLDTLRAIINLAATRGAFQGAELTQVGTVYDKLTSFLNSVVAEVESTTEPSQSAGNTSDIPQGV
jgi:hypothetical protein